MNKYTMIFGSIILSFFNLISFSMDQPLVPIFPKELLIAIGVPNDEARNTLVKTCKSLHYELSINSPKFIDLINHPLFNMSKKNTQWLAFNAAWNANTHLLKSVMKHMVQSDYVYQYEIECGLNLKFGLQRIVALRMRDNYNEIEKEAKKYNCKLHYYRDCDECHDLTMACYNKDDRRICELLNRDGVSADWDRMLFILIDKDSDKCISELSSYIKRNRFVSDGIELLDDCLQYQIFLKVAMKNHKYKAFEAIVKSDIFGCLNYIHSTNESVLDCIIYEAEKIKLVDGQKYIDTYRKNGGKSFDELNSNFWPCIIQ